MLIVEDITLQVSPSGLVSALLPVFLLLQNNLESFCVFSVRERHGQLFVCEDDGWESSPQGRCSPTQVWMPGKASSIEWESHGFGKKKKDSRNPSRQRKLVRWVGSLESHFTTKYYKWYMPMPVLTFSNMCTIIIIMIYRTVVRIGSTNFCIYWSKKRKRKKTTILFNLVLRL